MTDERKTVTLPLVWNETSDVAWLLAGNAPVGGVAQSGMADTFGQFYWWLKNDSSRLRYCPTREEARAALEAAVKAMGVETDDAADAARFRWLVEKHLKVEGPVQFKADSATIASWFDWSARGDVSQSIRTLIDAEMAREADAWGHAHRRPSGDIEDGFIRDNGED